MIKKNLNTKLIVVIFLIIAIPLLFILNVNKSHVNTYLSHSDIFSEEEILSASKVTTKAFHSDLKSQTLLSISYDDNYQKQFLKSVYSNPDSFPKSYANSQPDNLIVLPLSFKTGYSMSDGFEKEMVMDHWKAILTRKNNVSPWEMVEFGE